MARTSLPLFPLAHTRGEIAPREQGGGFVVSSGPTIVARLVVFSRAKRGKPGRDGAREL